MLKFLIVAFIFLIPLNIYGASRYANNGEPQFTFNFQATRTFTAPIRMPRGTRVTGLKGYRTRTLRTPRIPRIK